MSEISTIIGYGRFGELWAKLISKFCKVQIVESDSTRADSARKAGFEIVDIKDAFNCQTVWYAVPISQFEEILTQHLPYYNRSSKPLMVDLLSVKSHPKNVFNKLLPEGASAMLVHAMFGPDSYSASKGQGLKIAVDRFRAAEEEYRKWCERFKDIPLDVVELTADQHDSYAAWSQGIAHFIGRILGELRFETTPIDTLGAKLLQQVKTQACNDTWQLFRDLQTYNPHTIAMRVKLGEKQSSIFSQLLPNRINKEKLVVGIQGGKGSFNEEAARFYLAQHNIENFELVYLHTTKNVLGSLHRGEIDRGQFAMHNSLGGIVHESVEAMAEYNFKILDEFAIPIAHSLMIHPDSDITRISQVMAHPQVFRQCKTNLANKYPGLKLTSGEGELVDHAKVAEVLSRKELPLSTATMGSKVLAEIYGLKIVESNLQDSSNNLTSFLWVERPSY